MIMKFQIKLTIILFAIIFANIDLFCKNPLCAFRADKVWYFLNDDGTEMCPSMILDGISHFSEGKFAARRRNKDTVYFAYFNTAGKELFKVNTSLPLQFKQGYALTVKFLDEKGTQRLYGMIDSNGNIIFDNVLPDALEFSDSLAYIDNDERKGYIDLQGNFRITLDDKYVGYRFSEGLAAISDADLKLGFINKKGEIVIPLKYDEGGEFSEGLCKVYSEGGFGYINKNGDLVIAHRFDEARNFCEERAFVGMLDDNNELIWGFIDKDGRMIETFIYKAVNDFSEGLASVKKDKLWGFIDKNGNTIIDFQYSDADSFYNNLAFVIDRANKRAGYINKKGEFVIDFNKFEVLIDFRSNKKFYSFSK